MIVKWKKNLDISTAKNDSPSRTSVMKSSSRPLLFFSKSQASLRSPSWLFITAYVVTNQDTFSLTHGENTWHHPNENSNRDLWKYWLIIRLHEKILQTVYFLLQWYKAKILKINRRGNWLTLKLHIFGSIP